MREKEKDTILVEEDTPEELIKERHYLVGKIFSDRRINRETMESTMGKIWRISKQAAFTEVEKNMFMVTFATETDKYKVMSGKPWLFDSNLFALKDLDGQCQITKISTQKIFGYSFMNYR